MWEESEAFPLAVVQTLNKKDRTHLKCPTRSGCGTKTGLWLLLSGPIKGRHTCRRMEVHSNLLGGRMRTNARLLTPPASLTHTRRHKRMFVRTFIGIIHSPAPYPNPNQHKLKCPHFASKKSILELEHTHARAHALSMCSFYQLLFVLELTSIAASRMGNTDKDSSYHQMCLCRVTKLKLKLITSVFDC